MRALRLLLALPLVLAACDDYGSNNPDGGPGTGLPIRVLARPAMTPHAGDTLTFFVAFPDSASERYGIGWDLDERGQRILSGCTRGVCAKWIVPPGSGDYRHDVTVSSLQGLSRVPFKTLVP